MNPRASIAHHIPGRVRFAIVERRGDEQFFAMLSQRLSGIAHVHAVRSNAIAGSIVIEYSGALDELLQGAKVGEVLDLPERLGSAEVAADPADAKGGINLVSGVDLNPMYMAGVAFGMLAVVQALRGHVGVPAASAFWYAVATFQQARSITLVDARATGLEARD